MVTRERIQESVEKIVPTSTNFVRGTDGATDPEDYYRQVIGSALSALSQDSDSVFYLAYLASQHVSKEAAGLLSDLEALLGPGGIRALSNDEHVRVASTLGLSLARGALLRMDASIAGGSGGSAHLGKFAERLRTFLEDHVVPNVVGGGSSTAAGEYVRDTMSGFSSAWADFKTTKDEFLTSVDRSVEADLRSVIAARVSASLQVLVRKIEAQLPLLTTEAQSAQMEQVLSDLAAAISVAQAYKDSPSALGEVVIQPQDDLYTERTYKTATGVAQIAPVLVVLAGTNGKISVTPLALGVAGAAQDDLDSDNLTPYLVDAGVPDFTTTGVAPGHHLLLVATGAVHRVTFVEPTRLSLLPELPLALAGVRWLVVEDPPGTYLGDVDQSFWTAYTGGQTASTLIAQGTRGYFPRRVVVSGTGLTDRLYSSSVGEAVPYEATGTTFTLLSTISITLAGAVWERTPGTLSPGWYLTLNGPPLTITPETRPIYTITSALHATVALLDAYDGGLLGSGTGGWTIARADTLDYLYDPTVSLFGLGVEAAGSTSVVVTSPPSIAGTYDISAVPEDHRLRVDPAFAQHEDVVEWYIQLDAGEVYDPTATFLSSGVGPGTVIDVEGTPYVVDEVRSEVRLRFTTPYLPPVPGSPAAWRVHASSSGSDVFTQADGSDFSLVDTATGGSPTILTVDGEVLDFTRVLPGTTDSLQLRSGRVFDEAQSHAWSLRAGDVTYRFSDYANAPFTGVAPGTLLVLFAGTADEVVVPVASVLNSAEVTLAYAVKQGESGVPYAIYDIIRPGYEVLYDRLRYPIAKVVGGKLKLSRPLPAATGTGLTYFIVEPGRLGISHRLADEAGALAYDGATGFGQELVGQEVRLNYTIPRKSRITAVQDLDHDGVAETLTVLDAFEVGGRDVPYQVWGSVEGSTHVVKVPGMHSAAVEDVLTLWGEETSKKIVGSASGTPSALTLESILRGGRQGLLGVVTRGGGPGWGRWLLLHHILSHIDLAADAPFNLSKYVAQALWDRGATGPVLGAGAPAAVADDGDADETTPYVTITGIPGTARYGDRLTLSIAGGGEIRGYVTEVTGARVTLAAEVPVSVLLAGWSLQRTSVSSALWEARQMYLQVQGIRDACAAFTVKPSASVRAAVALLLDNGMSRHVDTLRKGDLATVVGASRTSGSYRGAAAASLQGVGGLLASARESTDGSHGNTALGDGFALLGRASTLQVALGEGANLLAVGEAAATTAASSAEDARNRAVYELTGDVTATQVSEQDATLPWLAVSGSKLDRINRQAERLKAALQYVVDNPDKFEDAP